MRLYICLPNTSLFACNDLLLLLMGISLTPFSWFIQIILGCYTFDFRHFHFSSIQDLASFKSVCDLTRSRLSGLADFGAKRKDNKAA